METALDEIKKYARKLDDAKIYYTLQVLKVKRIRETQITILKIFLSLRHFNINIVNVSLLEVIGLTNIYSTLHLLGDKGILTWVKGSGIKGARLKYALSEKFIQKFENI